MSFNNKDFEPRTTSKGTKLPLMNLKGKPYLQVAHRLVWFREDHPHAQISTEVIELGTSHAVFKATVSLLNDKNNSWVTIATGTKKETEENFADYIEKAETGAIGRALAISGYGTQFEPDLDEGDRLADAPIAIPKKEVVSGKGVQRQSKSGKGDSSGISGDAPESIPAANAAPVSAAIEAGGSGAGQEASAQTLADTLMLITSRSVAAIARRVTTKVALVEYMQKTYAVDDKSKLTEVQAKEFAAYLDNLIKAGVNVTK